MGSNERPLDFKPNALPTELGVLICRVGFNFFLLYSAIYSYNVIHCCIFVKVWDKTSAYLIKEKFLFYTRNHDEDLNQKKN